jgi:hypothetical protein
MIDEAFFEDENCPEGSKPPTASDGTEITDKEIAKYLTELYGNNAECKNTIAAIKDQQDKNIDLVLKRNENNTKAHPMTGAELSAAPVIEEAPLKSE